MSFDIYRRDQPPPQDAAPDDPNNFDVYKKPVTAGANASASGVDWEDVGKGAAGGLGRGTAGLLGLPGDISEYGARGLDYATRKIGGVLGVDVAPRAAQDPSYGSAAAKRNIESVTGPLYEPHTVPGQYASTVGEFAPAALIPGGGGIAARALNTVVPAVASETAGQVTKGTPAEPWARGITGVLSGVGAAKAITPSAPASAVRQAAVDTLESEGIPLTAGQRTGSRPIQWAESTAADMPGSAGRAADMNAAQRAAYDRAVTNQTFDPDQLWLRNVPEGTSLPDPRVVTAGKQSLSDEYDRLAQRNQIRSDPQLHSDLTAAQTKYEQNVLPSERTKDVEKIRNDITDKLVMGQGVLPGAEYQATRSRLGRLAQGTTDTELQAALKDIRGSLDSAMQRNLSPEDAAAWALNNRRYATMKQLEPAVAGAGENLSPARVAQTVRSGRDAQYAQQQSDMDKLSRAGSLVLKEVPQSGTAARLGMQSLFNVPTLLASGGGGLLGSTLGPTGAIVGAAAPFAAARAVLSGPGQAYLGNQAIPQNARDVIAQTLAQQAISQPSVIDRNERDRAEYEKTRNLRYSR